MSWIVQDTGNSPERTEPGDFADGLVKADGMWARLEDGDVDHVETICSRGQVVRAGQAGRGAVDERLKRPLDVSGEFPGENGRGR